MTKDDPITNALTKKFFDRVFNTESVEEIRAWLRQQPADEMELFLNSWNWNDDTNRETILRQELTRKRRIEKFEELGEDTVRADLAQGGVQYVGGPPEARNLAQEWLAEKECGRPQTTQAQERNGDGDHVKVKGKISLKEFSFDLMGKPRNLGIVLLYLALFFLLVIAAYWVVGNRSSEKELIDNGTEGNWRDKPLSEFLKQ